MSSTVTYAVPQKMIVDAGIISVGGTTIGASRGGILFDPGIELRHPPFDGLTTEIEGLHRIISYKSLLSGKFLDQSVAMMSYVLPGSTSDNSTPLNVRTPKEARLFYTPSTDYLTTVKFVGRRSDNKTIQISFARAVVRWKPMQTTDNDEALLDIEVMGVLLSTETNLNVAPFTYIENLA